MTTRERRRSARYLLGESAEVHLGARTVSAMVVDVSQHGMGLVLPPESLVEQGQTIWILVGKLSSYAITAQVVRLQEGGRIGVQFEEILEGPALEALQALPLAE